MFATSLRSHLLWPLVVLSLGLVLVSAAIALVLLRQQHRTAAGMGENVVSWRAAATLEESLIDLAGLLKDRVESVASLHARVGVHLTEIQASADQAEERELVNRVLVSYARYQARWRALPPAGDPRHQAAVRAAAEVLESETVPRCQALREYNRQRILDGSAEQSRVIRELAWGLAGVGVTGGGAGVLLGFVIARRLLRSIRRLQVRVQDAVGALGRELPAIVVTQEGDLDRLHDQMQGLVGQIEQTVSRLQQREREVLRAEQLAAVGQLAAGVAHEIRNPLTSIKLLVQAGREGDPPAGLPPEDLAVVEGEVRRLERSLQTFLDFARPAPPERSEVDLVGLVEHTLTLVRGRAAQQRVAVRFEHPDPALHLRADREQLRQVLVNLLLNALDAMPAGGQLQVALARLPGGSAELKVADSGPGIPPEVLPRLFEPFVSSKPTGVGLGLVISRRIVEDHGGTLRAANRPGGGAELTVRLPAGPNPSARAT